MEQLLAAWRSLRGGLRSRGCQPGPPHLCTQRERYQRQRGDRNNGADGCAIDCCPDIGAIGRQEVQQQRDAPEGSDNWKDPASQARS